MSLRARLLIGAGVIAVVLAVSAIVIAQTTRAHLIDQVDAQLRTAGLQLRAEPGRDDFAPGQGPRLSAFYIGVLTSDGELTTVAAPDVLGTEEAPLPQLSAADIERLEAGESITVATDDPDLDYRMQARELRGVSVLAVVALPLDDVQAAVRRLVAVEAVAVVAVLAVLGLVVWWVIRLGVRPVQQMTATASAIAAGDLSQRVPEGHPGTEAGELGDALNGMLGRIEESFAERAASEARLRQFVADASHELRTPVATIRGYAELYRAGALERDDELDDAMRRTEQEAVRMGSLVDDLLHLARLDQGRPLEQASVDLATVVDDVVRDARAVEPTRDITAVVAGPVVVVGDPRRLHQVLANLVGNALVHAPGAPIEVRASIDGDDAILEVADRGPGMQPADAERAFERFYRADASRNRNQGGSGLGLSIVEATVRAHGGTVGIDTAPGAGTTVRVVLPTRPRQPVALSS